MSPSFQDAQERAHAYATVRGLRVEHLLGDGKDGIVWSTNAGTAVKAHARPESYAAELACYRRLRDRSVFEVLGHHVPLLLHADDALLVIEMTIVQPPFLLDFAGAFIDNAPDFPEEVMNQWRQEKQEQFGVHWPRVEAVIDFIARRHGIHLLDLHPGNITFDPPGI